MEREFIGKNRKSVESIFISNYIRYETLNEMNKVFAGSTSNVVNIYIDLYHILNNLFRPDILLGGKTSLAAYILNMCSHYRSFYRKYYGVHARIYLVNTNGIMTSSERFVQDYNRDNNERMYMIDTIANFITRNCAIVAEICQYINDVYMVQAPFETSAIMHTLITDNLNNGKVYPNIILSNNPLSYQLALLPDTFVFSHKWVDGQIQYAIIRNDNIIESYLLKLKIAESTIARYRHISGNHLSLLMALNRLKSRNLRLIININKALSIINDRCNELGRSIFIDDITDILKENTLEVSNRLKAIDIEFQSNLYRSSSQYIGRLWDVNLQNPDMIKLINDKYFKANPLDLERI